MKPRLTLLLAAFIAAAFAAGPPAQAEVTEAQALAMAHLADVLRQVANDAHEKAAADWWIVENQLFAATQRYNLDYWPTLGRNTTIEQLLDNAPPAAPGSTQLLTAAGNDLTNANEMLERGNFWFMVASQALTLEDWLIAFDFFQLAKVKYENAATATAQAQGNLDGAQLQIDTANDLMTAALQR